MYTTISNDEMFSSALKTLSPQTQETYVGFYSASTTVQLRRVPRMLGSVGFFLFLQRTSQSALKRTLFVRSCGPSLKPSTYFHASILSKIVDSFLSRLLRGASEFTCIRTRLNSIWIVKQMTRGNKYVNIPNFVMGGPEWHRL
jgi:hypothetical protein